MSASVWRINPASRLHWRHWEEEYIVFNEASAHTHLFNEFGAVVLQLLQEAPRSTPQLAKELVSQYDIKMDAECWSYFQSLLADLDELGLIESCPA
jgi:PqqD family protein of HPr-rel-A system